MQDQQSRDELLKIAHDRLYPSLTNPSYLVQRRRREILGRWIDALPGGDFTVLDIGGRYQPYRPLLGNRVGSYVALDVLRTPFVTVIGSGQELPFRSETFDLVIATGVFEYFPEPKLAAAEVHRVLKRNGYLMMSVASVYPRVVEEEHWRYMPAGLRYVLSQFSSVDIVPEVASFGGFFRVTAASLNIIAKWNWLRTIVQWTAIPMLNLAGLMLDRENISRNDQIAGNYCALARKC
ncbi:MAG TPA: class I SAM-dependent methyltransferase [Candidatus Sulfotelmatobacter sp.]|nr:class I SAM-dependent methyltransferase [Candidatus Sulfotelmatobacter sp.]